MYCCFVPGIINILKIIELQIKPVISSDDFYVPLLCLLECDFTEDGVIHVVGEINY